MSDLPLIIKYFSTFDVLKARTNQIIWYNQLIHQKFLRIYFVDNTTSWITLFVFKDKYILVYKNAVAVIATNLPIFNDVKEITFEKITSKLIKFFSTI